MELVSGNLVKIDGLPPKVTRGLVGLIQPEDDNDYVLSLEVINKIHTVFKYDIIDGVFSMPAVNEEFADGDYYSLEFIIKTPYVVFVLLDCYHEIKIVVCDQKLNAISICCVTSEDGAFKTVIIDNKVLINTVLGRNYNIGVKGSDAYKEFLAFSEIPEFKLSSEGVQFVMRSVGYKNLFIDATGCIIQYTGDTTAKQRILTQDEHRFRIISAVDSCQPVLSIDTERELIYVKSSLGIQEIDSSSDDFNTKIVVTAEELSSGHYSIIHALNRCLLKFSD